jgi:hypothetical protein
MVNMDYECTLSRENRMDLRSAIASAMLILLVGCSSSPSVRDCTSDVDCGDGAVCFEGACTANSSPVAHFVPPTGLTTNRLVTLDATADDPEGRPVQLRWSVRATEGGCDPEAEPQVGDELDVVFWCPGTYEATVVPVDEQGIEGVAATGSFAVSAASGVPTVVTGAAMAAVHLCDAAIPACYVAGADGSSSLRLSAVASDPGGEPLTFEWIALPPERAAADPTLLVSFAAGVNSDLPIASIANGSGGPIAGVYEFRVRVRNASGLLAQAFQQVVVANEAPTLEPIPLLIPHRYADAQFVAEADLVVKGMDPEGDLMSLEGALAPAAPSGCTEEVSPVSADLLHVRIVCAIASALIGQTPRTLTVTLTDANGAAASLSAPLVIVNLAPKIVLSPSFANGMLELAHRVEPCALANGTSCFVADGPDPYTVVDPEGDPIEGYALTVSVSTNQTSSKAILSLDGATYRFRFETPTTKPLEFRSATGVSGFTFAASCRDPWGAAAALVGEKTRISNRAPIVREPAAAVSVNHSYDAARRRYVATAPGAFFEDPDGDPLVPSASASRDCTAATFDAGRALIACEKGWDYVLGGVPPLSEYLGTLPVTVTASDGWAAVSSPTNVTLLDRPATLSLPTYQDDSRVVQVESCACVSGNVCSRQWETGTTGMAVPLALADADGDPSLITATVTLVSSQPAPILCLPGICYPTINGTSGGWSSVTFSADAGVAGQPPEVSTEVQATCSLSRTCCN